MATIRITIFLLFTAICSVISVPLSLIDRTGNSYLAIARFWAKGSLILFSIKVKVTGLENISAGRNYIYASNHTSYLDIPAVIAVIPDNIRLVFRESLYKVPVWGWSLRFAPFIVVDNSSAQKAKLTIAKAIATIRNGASVLLFAEGTRTKTGEMGPFKRGAFRLAFDSGALIIPVAIKGAYDLLPRSQNLPKHGGTVTISLGAPLEQSTDPALTDREREFDLLHRTEASVRAML